MPRLSIQQFRAILASRTDPRGAVLAYRELSRRSDLAAGVRYADWPIWEGRERASAR